jgi:putative flavoprotein involved in K+ transport
MYEREAFDVVVIGAGQAGLSTGYHLAQRGLRFVILDAHERIGDVWRNRWDSLRLFTPAKFDGLDGMPFPAPPNSFPTKDEMADYLEAYAAHFDLPVQTGTRVERLSKSDDTFLLETNRGPIEARQVVVAMASYQGPRIPQFARELDAGIVQLHSSEYRSPSQLREGPVLLVGAGNSGAEIAMEISRSHPTSMSGRDVGEIPFRIAGFWGRLILARLVLRVVFHRLLTMRTPMGRRMRPVIQGKGGPLIRTRSAELAAAGVTRAPRMVGVSDGRPLLEDGRVVDVGNVIWCTGYYPGLSWIDLSVFDEQGRPRHTSGVADEEGLYFVGQLFLHAASSTMIHGVGRDAARIARAVARRAAEPQLSRIIPAVYASSPATGRASA